MTTVLADVIERWAAYNAVEYLWLLHERRYCHIIKRIIRARFDTSLAVQIVSRFPVAWNSKNFRTLKRSREWYMYSMEDWG